MARKKISFKEAIEEVETTINKIEDNALDIDQLFTEVKKSSKTLSSCKSKIYKAEKELEDFFKDLEEQQ